MTSTRPSVATHRVERAGRVPLWHLVPIAVVLVISSAFVGYGGYVFIDEAALLAQVDLFVDGSWTTERPLADVDPDGAYAPMARSTLSDDGFAPFPNHPLHVLLAGAAAQIGGDVGIRMLSVLGVLGAASAAGGLAAARSRMHSAAAMWLTAIASPLVFDANLVVAHAIAAALTGLAFVLIFLVAPQVLSPRTGIGVAVAVALTVAAGALLRSEVVLLGAVVGLVAVAHGSRGRVRSVVGSGLAALAAVAATYLLEPRWIKALAGSSSGPKVIAESSRGGAAGAIEGALTVLFGVGSAGVALVLGVVLAVAAVAALRLRPADPGFAVLLAGGGVLAAGIYLDDPSVVPGIVWAFPLLAAGAVSASYSEVWPAAIARSSQAVGAFAALVLVTQYSVGGGAEWGWRYVAVALPVVAAALSIPLVDMFRSGPPAARLALGGVVVVGLLVSLSGIVAQRRTIDRVDQLLDRTNEAFEGTDADVIVAADPSFGRFAWPRSITGDVITLPGGEGEMSDLLTLLGQRDVDRILLVWVGEEPIVSADRARVAGEVVTLLESAYVARPYELHPNTRSPS